MSTERTVSLAPVPPRQPGAVEAATPLARFVVRLDGSVRGDDLAQRTVAVTMPYFGRLARRVGDLVGAGEPVSLETVAGTRLTVQMSWTMAGEGMFRTVIHPVEARVVPTFTVMGGADFTVMGGADVNAALAYCVARFGSIDGVQWSAVLTKDTRVVAGAGHDSADLHHLPEIGTRMLAILKAIDDRPGEAFARVDFDGVSVMAATVGRHCLFARTERREEAEFGPVLDEVRTILAAHDLLAAETLVEAAVLGSIEGEEPIRDLTDVPPAPAPTPAASPTPVGARFRGVQQRQPGSRRRFGRR